MIRIKYIPEANLFVGEGAEFPSNLYWKHDAPRGVYTNENIYGVWETIDIPEFHDTELDTNAKALLLEFDDMYNLSSAMELGDEEKKWVDDTLPVPEGLALRGYQYPALYYCLEKIRKTQYPTSPVVLIADVPRMGKTPTSLSVVSHLHGNTAPMQNILIIPPATLKINWLREYNKWCYPITGLEAGLVDGQKDSGNPKTPALIINYDIIYHHREYLESILWDIVLCDESHRLKNPKAKRTKVVCGYGKKRVKKDGKNAKTYFPGIQSKVRLELSATPIYTRPSDLQRVSEEGVKGVRGVSKHMQDYFRFVHRYCAAHTGGFGLDVTGASNLHELNCNMRSSFMVRRTKGQLVGWSKGEDLTPRQTIPLPKSGLGSLPKKEETLIGKNLAVFEKRLSAYYTDDEVGKVMEPYKELGLPQDFGVDETITVGEMAKLRKELGVAKIPMCVQFIQDFLDSSEADEKIVVFAHHRDVVTGLREKLKAHKPCVIIGGLSAKQKQEQIDTFKDPELGRKVFIGNIQAAGEGINLSEADTTIFCELVWPPAEILQAEERIWDAGLGAESMRGLMHYKLLVEDSLDDKLMNVLTTRMENMKKALD